MNHVGGKAFRMYMEENKSQYDKTLIIEFEVERLSKKYNKEFLDCKDLMDILGVGRDNVRKLMRSEGFPTISIGNRKVVPIMSFVLWQQR
jgi:hypothetical protein